MNGQIFILIYIDDPGGLLINEGDYHLHIKQASYQCDHDIIPAIKLIASYYTCLAC